MKAPPKPCTISYVSKMEVQPFNLPPVSRGYPKCDTHQYEWACQSYDATTKCPIARIEELEYTVEKLVTLFSK